MPRLFASLSKRIPGDFGDRQVCLWEPSDGAPAGAQSTRIPTELLGDTVTSVLCARGDAAANTGAEKNLEPVPGAMCMLSTKSFLTSFNNGKKKGSFPAVTGSGNQMLLW